MPRRRINGTELYYELSGRGEPLVLVHGAWTDHTSWRLVAAALAETNRVLAYDRRGHSRSARPDSSSSRRTEEDDLAALVEALDLGPAHLVGSSHGASIVLGVAARRPEMVRSVIAHEPAVLGLARPDSGLARLTRPVVATIERVAADLRRGDAEGGVVRFVEEIVFGPGTWQTLPVETRRTMVANAPTFLDMLADPHWADPPPPHEPAVAVLLTDGGASPAWLPAIVDELAATTHRRATRHTFPGAGHAPHLTHPAEHVAVVQAFVGQVGRDRLGAPTGS